MLTLTDQVVLITGGGSGIGAATALLFAQSGAKVALLGWLPNELAETAEQIKAVGGESISLTANTASEHSVNAAFEELRQRWGRLDVLFANAGINGTWAPLHRLGAKEWDETMNVNLRGTFLVTKAALPLLKERGGSVIITSSVNGTRMFSTPGATAYSCSKAGQLAFAKSAAVELAPYRIRVNVICPGYIQTPIHEHTRRRGLEELRHPVVTPEGPIPLTGHAGGQPCQVAQLALFLASGAASHITGTEVFIDGGQSLVQS